jgi:hypothetical protein
MASEMEPLVSTKLHRILKAEWLSIYVEAHKKAFSVQNILAGFRGTGIRPFKPSKVINRIAPVVQDSTEVHSLTPVKANTPYTESVLPPLLFMPTRYDKQMPRYSKKSEEVRYFPLLPEITPNVSLEDQSVYKLEILL